MMARVRRISAAEGDAALTHDRRASFALPGLLLAGGALLCASLTLPILLGLTRIEPTSRVLIASAVVNSLFIVGLMVLLAREVLRLFKARHRGRAAALSAGPDDLHGK